MTMWYKHMDCITWVIIGFLPAQAEGVLAQEGIVAAFPNDGGGTLGSLFTRSEAGSRHRIELRTWSWYLKRSIDA